MKRLLALLCLAALLAGLCAPAYAADVPRGVFYEIYVRAFADSDGDGVGDLSGLRAKLPYLEDLGVSGLWLMPVFDARSDHGYDTIDYDRVDPDYGTNDDLRALVEDAHARGIAVILDLVVNHTSSEHPWFKDALAGGGKRGWYHFYQEGRDSAALLLAKPWGAPVWHESPGGRYYGIFWEGMPDLDLSNPDVRDELVAVAKRWLALGVDGFRLDATSHFFAFGEEEMAQQTERSGAFLADFRDALRADYPDCYLVGEAWESLAKRLDILKGIDSVFNFDFGEKLIALVNQGGDAGALLRALAADEGKCREANPDFLDATFLTNHDQNRVMAQLKAKPKRYKLAANVLLTYGGNPFLYYGEELGMLGAKPDEEIRTPFLWGADDPAQCDFIQSKYNQNTAPLSAQADDPDSVYAHVRALARLRRGSEALREGALLPLETGHIKLMAYERATANDRVLVMHNFAQEALAPTLEGATFDADEGALLFGALADGLIPPMSTIVLQQ